MPELDDVAEDIDINNPPTANQTDEDIEIEGEDISAAQTTDFSDWVEPKKDVVLEVTHAEVKTYTPDSETDWKTRSLKLYLRVVGGEGEYKNKVFFPNSKFNRDGFLVTVNRESGAYDFTKNKDGKLSKWYLPPIQEGQGGAFAGYKDVLVALGFSVNPTPKINRAFLDSLVGKRLMADINKINREVYDKDKGQSVKVKDEFENTLSNYRPVATPVATVDTAEAAVA